MTNRFVQMVALGLLLPGLTAAVTACDFGGEQNNLEEQNGTGNVEDDDEQNEGQNNQQDDDEDGEQNEQDGDND